MNLFNAAITGENSSNNRLLRLIKQFFASIGELIKLNILFILCLSPVVTAGAALGGLTEAAMRLADDSSNGVWFDFKNGVKKHGKAFSGYLLIEILVSGVLFFSIVQYGRMSAYPFAIFLGVLCMGLFMFCFAAACYLHSLRIYKQLPLKKALKNAVLMVLLGLPDFGFLGAELLLGWLSIKILPHSLPLFILLLPASGAFISCFATLRTIQRYAVC